MKTTKILYWVFNGLFAFVMFGSAIPDVMSSPDAVRGMHGLLGYPLYFIPFLGAAIILGALTIIIPGLPVRLKEWAYAGLTFDLIAATYSLHSIPNPEGPWYFMIIFLVLAAAAYIYYHKKLSLGKQA
jgi:hypothetical protein